MLRKAIAFLEAFLKDPTLFSLSSGAA